MLALPESRPASLLALLCLGLIAVTSLGVNPTPSFAQDDATSIQLPNPDGRDPVFDRSQRDQLIEIDFVNLADGTDRSLDDLPAQLRLINFWATWCAPCIRELPSLSGLAEQFPESVLRVVAISLDRAELGDVSDFLSELDVPGVEWFVDQSRQSGEDSSVIVLPTTLFVDVQGRELGRVVGSPDWESAEAVSLIKELLASDVD